MLRFTFPFFLATFFLAQFLACNNQTQTESSPLETKLKVYLQGKIDSTVKIDSLKLIKLDTLTQFDLIDTRFNKINEQFNQVKELGNSTGELMSFDIDLIRLDKIKGSKTVPKNHQDDFRKHTEKSKELIAEMDTLHKIMDDLNKQLEFADTLKPVGFLARCWYHLTMKDKSSIIDSSGIYLNMNKDILTPNDFIKIPYQVDFNKYKN